MKKNILITGLPGIGKTTLIVKIIEAMKDVDPVGFYTEEIREQGIRKGFSLISASGDRSILSHVDIKTRFRVGKYSVDVAGFEAFIERIPFFDDKTAVIVIDEIGKMECSSTKFTKLVSALLESEKLFIATIALKGEGFIAEVKRRPDVELYEMTRDNRNDLLQRILNYTSAGPSH
ncbi:MAG TPA: NTPase [Syntrophales bacterium]|nr:NTPase [Syntrophales bacterium]